MSLLAQATQDSVPGAAQTGTTSLGTFTPPTQAYSANSSVGQTALVNAENLLSTIIGFITILAGLFFIFNFVTGALDWVNAPDHGKVEKAREKMTQSVIGLVIVIISYGLIGLIGRVVGLDLLNPGQMLRDLIPKV
jgi:hypothetical protein